MNTIDIIFTRKRLARQIRAALHIGLPFSLLAGLPGIAFAGPSGGAVVGGQATIHTPDSATTVIDQHSERAAINWQRFSIAGNEYVQFNQPSTQAIALNRVVGVDPSVILGHLTANGQVFLVNPRGVYFGPGARVDVAGLVASIFDIDPEDFMAGQYVFTRPADAPEGASVVNDGVISARERGYVVLAGDYSANHGVIQAQLGTVVLASGRGMTLALDGDGLLSYVVDGAAVGELAGVENTGEVYADGGRVFMTAKVSGDLIGTAVNQQGLVQARGIVESNGEIYLSADGGDIVQGGSLNADTTAAGSAGKIILTASHDISLESDSSITASGAPGGVHDGGEVRIVAENDLYAQAGSNTQVQGGIDGGNGGFLELSGHHGFVLDGNYGGSARHAGFAAGTLYLDPTDIDITTGACGVTSCIDPNTGLSGFATVTVATGAGGQLRVLSAIGNEDLDAGAKLELIAGADLLVDAAIGTSGTRFAHDLDLKAGGDVVVRKSIYLANNALTIAADTDGNAAGSIDVTSTGSPVTVDTQGGIAMTGQNFVIDGGSSSSGSASVKAGTDINISLAGNMEVRGGAISADTYAGTSTQDADATVEAGGNITVIASMLKVLGGDAEADASYSGDAVATAIAKITAGQNINLNLSNGLQVEGGKASASASNGSDTASAMAVADAIITAGGALTVNVTSGGISVKGGVNPLAEVSSSSSRSAQALARGVMQGASVAITVGAGGLTVAGGAQARASNDYGDDDGKTLADASARIAATAGGLTLAVNGGDLIVRGGASAYADATEVSGNSSATAKANAELSALTDVSITVTSGNVAISGGDDASATGSGSDSYNRNVLKTFSNALVSAGRDMSIKVNTGSLTVAGGNSASARASDTEGGSNNRVEATATVKAARNLNIVTGGLFKVLGGQNADARASDGTDAVNIAAADASAKVEASTGILSINAGGGINVIGGSNLDAKIWHAENSLQAQALANATLLGNVVNLNVAGNGLLIRGGSNASADASGSGSNQTVFAQAWARAQVSAATSLTVTVTAGGLTVNGGSDGSAEVSDASSMKNIQALANTNAELLAGTDISLNVHSGGLEVRGGEGAGAEASADSNPNGRYIATAKANGLVAAGRSLTLNLNGGNLQVQGGDARTSVDDGPGGAVFVQATANADAALTAVTDLVINGAGNVNLTGGRAAAVFSDAAAGGELSATANANARLVAGGSVSVNATGGISFSGGLAYAGVNGASGGGGVNTTNAGAEAEIVSVGGTTLNTSNGPVDFVPGSAGTSGSGSHTANADVGVTAGGTLSIVSGGDVLDFAVSESGGFPPSVIPARTRITAGALNIRAAGDLFLPTAALTVHSGGLPGEGDSFLTTNIIGLGISPPPSPNPNAVFSAGNKVTLNELTMTGSFPYLVLQGAEIEITAPVALPNASDILVQWKPPDPDQPVGLSALASAPGACTGVSCLVNFFNDTGFSQFPGTTHAIGSSNQNALIQVTEPINIGSQNMVFVGPDNQGLDLITTTGIVGVVEALVTTFIVPTVDEDLQSGDDDEDNTDGESNTETDESSQPDGTINHEESNAGGMCSS